MHSIFPPDGSAQVVIEDPIVIVGTNWANHKIDSYHFNSHVAFAFVDDGSVWCINPMDADWVEEDREYLVNTVVTLMPEAGTEDYPHRIIVHNDSGYGWKDFTVRLISMPLHSDTVNISSMDKETGLSLNLSIPSEDGRVEYTLWTNPLDSESVKRWDVGQKVIVGGIWFPEYDPNGPKDYDCTYLYVLYNYETQEFVFFAL